MSRLSDFKDDHFFSNLSWKKIIKRDFFTIINRSDKKNQKISGFALTVNGENLYSDEICLPENELSKVKIVVKANGYKKFEETVDLNLKDYSSDSPFEIELTKEEEAYVVIPYSVKSGKAEIKYPISIEDWKECSIEGYRRNKCENEMRFKYDSRYWIRSNGKLIILVLFLVLLLGGGIGSGSMIIKNNISERKYTDSIGKLNNEIDSLKSRLKSFTSVVAVYALTNVEPAVNSVPNDTITAITYLDNNKTWWRNQMDSIKYLEGLWDVLNSREIAKIEKWDEKLLSKSQKWKTLRQTVKKNGSGPFRGENQFDIKVEDYINSFRSKPPKPRQEQDANTDRINGL